MTPEITVVLVLLYVYSKDTKKLESIKVTERLFSFLTYKNNLRLRKRVSYNLNT